MTQSHVCLASVVVCWLVLAAGKHVRAKTQQQQQAPVRVLALFSGTSNDLGLDHRLGRQVLKLAAARAARLHPELAHGGALELVVHSDDAECTSSSKIPSVVAEEFYLGQQQPVSSDLCVVQTGGISRQALDAALLGDGTRHEYSARSLLERCSKFQQANSTKLGQLVETLARPTHAAGQWQLEAPKVASSAALSNSRNAQASERHFSAIIGPSCDFLVDLIARMAAYWRTPIYTVTSISANFARKDVYPTLTRLSPSLDHVNTFVLRVLERFKWVHVSIVLDETQVENVLALENFKRSVTRLSHLQRIVYKVFPFTSFQNTCVGFKNTTKSEPGVSQHTSLCNRSIGHKAVASNTDADSTEARRDRLDESSGTAPAAEALQQHHSAGPCTAEARQLLEQVRQSSRVVLLLLNNHLTVRRLLLCSHELQFNNGEFTFLALNLGLKSQSSRANDSSEQQKQQIQAEADQIGTAPASREAAYERQQTGASSAPAGSARGQSYDWYVQDDTQTNNEKAREMFESLMVFSSELPIGDEFNVFVEQTLDAVKQDYPGFQTERSLVGQAAVALHDSLLLAVEAELRHRRKVSQLAATVKGANETAEKWHTEQAEAATLEDNGESSSADEDELDEVGNAQRGTSGYEAPLMWNERYAHGLMASMHINSNGDQELDYVLSDLEPELGVMRPVVRYLRETRQILMLPDSYVHWPRRTDASTQQVLNNDDTPPDEPECGFTGEAERCVDRQNLYAALTITAALFALGALIGLVSVRRYNKIRYQMQLDDYWWKIGWAELQFVQVPDSLAGSRVSGIVQMLAGAGGNGKSSDGGALKTSALRHTAASATASSVGKPATSGASCEQSQQRRRAKRHNATVVPQIITPSLDSPKKQSTVDEQQGRAESGEQEGEQPARCASMVDSKILLGGSCGSVHFRSEMSATVRASSLAVLNNKLVVVKMLNFRRAPHSLVASAPSLATQLDVTHELLVELKSIRDLVHENLARFVGLCIEPGHESVIVELYSRGCLRDLLLNDSISIDWPLKCSIIGDICNGLAFIQTTLLNYHGRLKSTNVLLDGRLTVKLADFGLRHLHKQLEPIADGKYESEPRGTVASASGTDLASGHEGPTSSRRNSARPSIDEGSLVGSGAQSQASYGRKKSTTATIYNMDSVSMCAPRQQHSSLLSASGTGGGVHATSSPLTRSALGGAFSGNQNHPNAQRRRGQARFFWTAPEHLRAREPHLAGSKRGDIYSLAIVLFEILTRREPYHYGTNAQPNWRLAKRDQRACASVCGSAAGLEPPSGTGGDGVGSLVVWRRSSRLTSLTSSGGTSYVGAAQTMSPRQRPGRNRCPLMGSISEQSGQESAAAGLVVDRATSVGQPNAPAVQAHNSPGPPHKGRGPHPRAIDDNDGQEAASDEDLPLLTADRILDQLRMGVLPEPVRPYLPDWVLVHDFGANNAHTAGQFAELVRACWHEQPGVRPSIDQVRGRLRKLTGGATCKNYLDNLFERLQTYTNELERLVDAKSADILFEKQRTEVLLYQLVPKFVAEKLRSNEPIVPQVFDSVTIFFSDIVGFEKYAAVLSPWELVDLLNCIYSSFESIIKSFDVTKIETILDQFLVASGISLPVASGEEPDKLALDGGGGESTSKQQAEAAAHRDARRALYHRTSAEQVARMALCIRDLVKSLHFRQELQSLFQSSASKAASTCGTAESGADPSKPSVTVANAAAQQQSASSYVAATLNIRVGIHSGRVCAGIVGVKRPKFCLIGDTVNVASRMHTNSKANRIQISADTRGLLEHVPGFAITPRGKIEVKGKGAMETFWLDTVC